MITVLSLGFPGGHTSHDHLLPDPDRVFAALIGASFRTLRDIKDAVWRAAKKEGECFPHHQTCSLVVAVEVVMCDGSHRTFHV